MYNTCVLCLCNLITWKHYDNSCAWNCFKVTDHRCTTVSGFVQNYQLGNGRTSVLAGLWCDFGDVRKSLERKYFTCCIISLNALFQASSYGITWEKCLIRNVIVHKIPLLIVVSRFEPNPSKSNFALQSILSYTRNFFWRYKQHVILNRPSFYSKATCLHVPQTLSTHTRQGVA